MRELKFRVWDKKSLKYTDNKLGYSNGPYLFINGKGVIFWNKEIGWIGNDKDFIIQQFTGLKDKNGKDIYEGDIIIRNNEKKLVKWIGGDDTDYQGYDLDNVFGQWEILGNMLKNPELLK